LSKSIQYEQFISVNILTVILAGITIIICAISYFWPPKSHFLLPSLIIYLVLTTTVGSLIISTGGLSSPFTPLLILAIVFSDVFGLWGIIPIAMSVASLTFVQYMDKNLSMELIVALSFSTLLPLCVSFIIWHNRINSTEKENDSNKSYRNLASELSEVASKSEVVINAIGDGVMAIDNNGIIQLINPAAQIITGWTREESITLNYQSIIKLVDMKGDLINGANNPISQALNTNTEFRTSNLTLVTKSGKKIMISLVASPVSETSSGVILVFHDITKEKAEEREQAEFISTASHEMRTPVASIEGYLGLAMNPNTAQVDERAKDFIMKAHASAEHLGRLFQDLLDVSKADDGRMTNNPTIINVIEFVQEILQGMEPKATEKGLKLNFIPKSATNEKLITPLYSVNLDKDHLREAIDNILENAIKYTPTGEISVDITGDDDHVTISVKDSGIGIPAEDMPHLFQKFYRVENKETNDIGGTGLGLYLSRRLVEIMGGRIWAESKHKAGSTFHIQLPRINNQEAENIASQHIIQPISNEPQPEQVAQQAEENKIKPAKEVPRGESLTPEQIAAYVQKQSELAKSEKHSEQIIDQPTEAAPITQPTLTPENNVDKDI
jgi:PAS domain S-box-containing protein